MPRTLIFCTKCGQKRFLGHLTCDCGQKTWSFRSPEQPPTQALRGRNLDLEPYGQGKGDHQ